MTCVTRVRLPGCQAGSAIALRSTVHVCLGEYRECVLVQLTYNAASSYYGTINSSACTERLSTHAACFARSLSLRNELGWANPAPLIPAVGPAVGGAVGGGAVDLAVGGGLQPGGGVRGLVPNMPPLPPMCPSHPWT